MIVRRASPCVDSSQRIVRDSRTLPKLRSQNGENIETQFLERAKYYQFAAAMTENPQEIERLCDIVEKLIACRISTHSRTMCGVFPTLQPI
jgi:hypothetical protein